ncbi:MAG: cation diffusion facilitator family transporter [Candidatus Sphingomonas colombiensis]|nr:cation diffusion facilitator family transporter [Sphingomonas sp.]WEK43378.1 MAG: cation diffusion facilitator family transporter [Sphingomonas sp.]
MVSGRNFVIYAALSGNLAIALTKGAAAAISGSSSMLTESIHSLVDTTNQGLLLYGLRRSKRPADVIHPFGYGRELYFWSFVVALMIFAGGAAASLFEGIVHFRQPEPITKPGINFLVLGVAFLFEGASWTIALREFRRTTRGEGWWRALRRSKDPATFVVLFEDSAALIGIIIAATAIGTALWTGDARCDGVGSILIGVLLGAVALLLARESKGLLIGERARPELSESIAAIARVEPGVCKVNEVLTVHLAPEQVMATVSLDFDDALDTRKIERAVANIETRAKARHGEVTRVFIRPQSAQTIS